MCIKQILNSTSSFDWHTHLAKLFNYTESTDFLKVLENFLQTFINFKGIAIITYKENHTPLLMYDNYTSEERIYKINTYIERAYLLDPLLIKMRQNKAQGIYQLSDSAPDCFEQSDYFQQYFKVLNIKDELGIAIELEENIMMYIFLGLHKTTDISANDMTAIKNILPVLISLSTKHWHTYKNQYMLWENPQSTIDKAFEAFGQGILTQREQEIVSLILQGYSTKAVAKMLYVSDGTVKVHRKNIYNRLGISTQSQLFKMFLDHLTDDLSGFRNITTEALSYHNQ